MKALLLTLSFLVAHVHAETATIKIKDANLSDDTAIVVKRVAIPSGTLDQPEYELMQGTEDVEGEPALGSKAARSEWKTACADWKKEFKEMNKTNKIMTMSCGSPSSELLANGQTAFSSVAHYAIRVRIRSKTPAAAAPKKSKPAADASTESDEE